MNKIELIKKEIIKYGCLLQESGLVLGTGGNLSVFLKEEELMLITPSGLNYNDLIVNDIVVMKLSGEIVEGKRKPSIEKSLHRKIYLRRNDVNAVIHTHSIYASSVAAVRKDLPVILDTMVPVFGGPVKTAEYAGIGTDELAENAVKALESSSAVLLANHGVVGVGKNLKTAFEVCNFCEACAKTFILAKAIGEPVILDTETVEQEKSYLDKRYGQ